MNAERGTEDLNLGNVSYNSRRVFLRSAFIVLTSSLLFGCAIPHVPSRAVYEDPVNFVRLERDIYVLDEAPYTKHSHPLIISAGELERILRGISVKQRRISLVVWIVGEAIPEQAFTDEEIALLAPRLAEALSRAQPNERVTYYLSRPETSIKRVITSGGLYVKEQQLHFILGNHRIVYGIPAYGMVYDRRYPMRPTAAKAFDLLFQPREAVVPQETGFLDTALGNEKDELVLDLHKLHIGQPMVMSTGAGVSADGR
jgi:hypothetical protein